MAVDQVIRIAAAQHEQIAKAAKKHGVSASEEIRLRLGMTLEADEATTQLVLRIIRLAQLQERGGHGKWHEDPSAFVIFEDAVRGLLHSRRPTGKVIDAPSLVSALLAKLAISEKVEP